uniref:Myotrophin n=1 Tax=Romanomermis culicivorax TaxID=13658 RepID=A0A915I1Z9_ROMCU
MSLSAAIWSIKNGDLDEVKKFIVRAHFGAYSNALLFQTGENANCDLDGRKPIHIAADFGHNAIIEYLLSVGADINALDNHGLTALLTAVYEGHTETVKLLLNKGAKKDVVSPDGRSCAECAEKPDIRALLTA